MKCPFRKVTSYSKVVKVTDVTSSYEVSSYVESCSESEAHYKTEDFAKCISNDCPFYFMNSCNRTKD